jgi:RNA methyltransferase, TrmH family
MITSTANERIKSIRKLREKKFRSETGTFYIEGIRIVVEAMRSGKRVQTLIVAPELVQSPLVHEILEDAGKAHIELLEVSKEVFESFSLKEGPQGVAAVVQQCWDSLDEIDWTLPGLWVGLDAVADPGNLGTIMRTMDAVAARGILLIGPCTDPYDTSAIRASMGAAFALKFVKASVEEMQELKRQHGLFLVGTSDAASQDYQDVSYPQHMVLMMGSERQGLQKPLVDLCDQMVSIPMAGRSDSLNLAVATGVMLYEVYNQHRRNQTA